MSLYHYTGFLVGPYPLLLTFAYLPPSPSEGFRIPVEVSVDAAEVLRLDGTLELALPGNGVSYSHGSSQSAGA